MQSKLLQGSRLLAAGLVGIALALAQALPSPAAEGGPRVVVNVNTASLEELQVLPGIGESRARAILTARKARGGFRSVEELLEVRGIGPANLERLRPLVSVRGQTRIPAPPDPR